MWNMIIVIIMDQKEICKYIENRTLIVIIIYQFIIVIV